jgi:hypothetical protein
MGTLRAADAERRRVYMMGIAQAFANEEIDGPWASSAALRINFALDGDEGLKGIAHKVECRHQTCRVEISDDGSQKLSNRLQLVSHGLADLFRSVRVERVDRADGGSAVVLYMSAQRPEQPAGGRPK